MDEPPPSYVPFDIPPASTSPEPPPLPTRSYLVDRSQTEPIAPPPLPISSRTHSEDSTKVTSTPFRTTSHKESEIGTPTIPLQGPEADPTTQMGATVTSLQWDVWEVPEPQSKIPFRDDLPPQSLLNGDDKILSDMPSSAELPASMPTYDSSPAAHGVSESKYPHIQLSMDSSIVRENEAGITSSDSQLNRTQPSEVESYSSLAPKASKVSLLSASASDTASSSRGPSVFTKESSVWSSDTTFTASTSSTGFSHEASDGPPASIFPIKRKPIKATSSFDSTSTFKKPSVEKMSVSAEPTGFIPRGSLTPSPRPIENGAALPKS